MYDSVTVSQLPGGGYAYAGYVDGSYANFPELERTYPHAHLLSISVTGNPGAHAVSVDDENGDANNPQAVAFIKAKIAAKVWRPVAYTQASNLATLESDLGGIPRGEYRLWSAHYTGTPHLCSRLVCGYGGNTPADATQYAANPYNYTAGRNIDISVLSKNFFAAAPNVPVPDVDFRGPSEVKAGYYWWEVIDSGNSLAAFAKGRKTSAETLIAHTLSADSPIGGVNKVHFENYAKWNPRGNGQMPAGLVFYTAKA